MISNKKEEIYEPLDLNSVNLVPSLVSTSFSVGRLDKPIADEAAAAAPANDSFALKFLIMISTSRSLSKFEYLVSRSLSNSCLSLLASDDEEFPNADSIDFFFRLLLISRFAAGVVDVVVVDVVVVVVVVVDFAAMAILLRTRSTKFR